MIAEIIPQIRLPKSIGIFDYQIPKELELKIKLGQVVTVPFRKRPVDGLVYNLKKSTSIKKPLADILTIKEEKPLLTWQLIKLINLLTKYYHLSPALWLKSILPQIPKKVYNKPFKKIITQHLDLKVSKPKIAELKKVAKSITQEKKPSLLHYDSVAQKVYVYLSIINQYLKKGLQIAIIVPEMTDLAILYPIIAHKFTKTAYYHGHMAKNQQFKIWNDILNGQVQIIVGTRPLCFAPFKNLGLVIVDQAENDSHKQYDQNPRYHTLKVLEELVKIDSFKLILASRSPTINTFQQTRSKKMSYHNITDKAKTILKIVDLNQELKSGNYTFLSNELARQMVYHLNQNNQIFLFANRKGLSTRVFCQDCGFLFICPNCGLPLTSYADLKLVCHHCDHQENNPKTCPNCHSVKIKFGGLGLEKVVENVKKLFPQSKIIGLSADNFTEQNNYSDYDIIIGTDIVLKNCNLPRLELIGIINADSTLNYPDFSAAEKTYAILNFLAKYKKNIYVVLQTFSPDNYVIKAVAKDDYRTFYQKEKQSRQEFGYPPFKKLIKLIFQDSDPRIIKQESERLYERLQEQSPKNWQIISLEATPYKQRNRYRHLIIIKYAGRIPQSFIKLIPDNWLIDIDPINFE